MKVNMLLVLMISFLLSGCSDPSDNKTSSLAKPYQEKFAEAWEKASQGKSPVNTCLSVGVTATSAVSAGKNKNNEAQQAFEACYVDAFVHYANVHFSQADNAKVESTPFIKGCSNFRNNLRANLLVMGGEFASKLDVNIDDLNNKIREGLVETATLCPGYDHYFD